MLSLSNRATGVGGGHRPARVVIRGVPALIAILDETNPNSRSLNGLRARQDARYQQFTVGDTDETPFLVRSRITLTNATSLCDKHPNPVCNQAIDRIVDDKTQIGPTVHCKRGVFHLDGAEFGML
jgi:hypothetical protein